MRSHFRLDQAERAIRSKVCDGCPRATPGCFSANERRPCEANCDVFVEIGRLGRILELRDPMLQSPAVTIERHLNEAARRRLHENEDRGDSWNPIRHHRRDLRRILRGLTNCTDG